jgi:hypothetical protein
VYCEFSKGGDTIYIQEVEIGPSCDCNCLYDLNIEINGISSKLYHIQFIEPYIGDQNELFFDVDLSAHTEGSFGVVRTQYPWGEY